MHGSRILADEIVARQPFIEARPSGDAGQRSGGRGRSAKTSVAGLCGLVAGGTVRERLVGGVAHPTSVERSWLVDRGVRPGARSPLALVQELLVVPQVGRALAFSVPHGRPTGRTEAAGPRRGSRVPLARDPAGEGAL